MSPNSKPRRSNLTRLFRSLESLLVKVALQTRFDNVEGSSQHCSRHSSHGTSEKGDPCLGGDDDAADFAEGTSCQGDRVASRIVGNVGHYYGRTFIGADNYEGTLRGFDFWGVTTENAMKKWELRIKLRRRKIKCGLGNGDLTGGSPHIASIATGVFVDQQLKIGVYLEQIRDLCSR